MKSSEVAISEDDVVVKQSATFEEVVVVQFMIKKSLETKQASDTLFPKLVPIIYKINTHSQIKLNGEADQLLSQLLCCLYFTFSKQRLSSKNLMAKSIN